MNDAGLCYRCGLWLHTEPGLLLIPPHYRWNDDNDVEECRANLPIAVIAFISPTSPAAKWDFPE